MFTPEDISRTRQEFWTTFGKYMSPVPSSEGTKTNWVNYHTTVKFVYFRMEAGVKAASIFITIEHPDPVIREALFEQFLKSKRIFRTLMGEPWQWHRMVTIEGKVVSRISKELHGVSVMKKEQWGDLISFFKPRIMALDAFWENARYGFEGIQ